MKETYRQEGVKCGKKGCKRCPHGPYWYAYWREGGKLKKRYIGKKPPWEQPGFQGTPPVNPWDAIFDVRRASARLAAEILGLPNGCTKGEARRAYYALVKVHHPDKGGDAKMMQYLSAAWEVISYHYASQETFG